jgi:hypothetical protein
MLAPKRYPEGFIWLMVYQLRNPCRISEMEVFHSCRVLSNLLNETQIYQILAKMTSNCFISAKKNPQRGLGD